MAAQGVVTVHAGNSVVAGLAVQRVGHRRAQQNIVSFDPARGVGEAGDLVARGIAAGDRLLGQVDGDAGR